jgi:protein TonB
MTETIVAASTHKLPTEHPDLPVIPTVMVQSGVIQPPQNLQFGLPNGREGIPSDGPGNGPGIGTGDGPGAGSGRGRGVGPGQGWNIGNGPPQIGGDPNDHLGPLTSKLVLLNSPRPDYTEEARREKIQGQIIVEAMFRSDGTISSIRVVRGLGYGLDEKAIEAVSKIRFRPAERQNRPVDVRQKITVTFQLL